MNKNIRTLSVITTLFVAGGGVLAGCDPGEDPVVLDASINLPPDAACPTVFRDADGDGFGSPISSMQSCAAVAGFVANDDDCDDRPGVGDYINPFETEVCDGLNNDCNAATSENAICPSGCRVEVDTGNADRRYLFCGIATTLSWTSARTTCLNHGYKLARIDNGIENEFLRLTAIGRFGNAIVQWWIGGTDSDIESTEGNWEWSADNELFWVGNMPPFGTGGAPQAGRYTNWRPGQPDNGGTDPIARPDDCAAQLGPNYGNGTWNDEICTTALPFVCERY